MRSQPDRTGWSLSDYQEWFGAAIEASPDAWREATAAYDSWGWSRGSPPSQCFGGLLKKAIEPGGEELGLADASVAAVAIADGFASRFGKVKFGGFGGRDPFLTFAEHVWDRLEAEWQEWRDGIRIDDLVPQSLPSDGSTPSESGGQEVTSHSSDFTSVIWFGKRYTFAKGQQAQVVKLLWEAYEEGGHTLAQETIAEAITPSASRFELAKVFRRRREGKYEMHAAWGTMIQQGGKGCYHLVPPESA